MYGDPTQQYEGCVSLKALLFCVQLFDASPVMIARKTAKLFMFFQMSTQRGQSIIQNKYTEYIVFACIYSSKYL